MTASPSVNDPRAVGVVPATDTRLGLAHNQGTRAVSPARAELTRTCPDPGDRDGGAGEAVCRSQYYAHLWFHLRWNQALRANLKRIPERRPDAALDSARPGRNWRLAYALSLDAIWFLLPAILCLAVLDLATVGPNDFWWHLRTGQIISQTHVIPKVDLFSFTEPGMPWTNQSWLMEIMYYALYQAGGLPLILFSHALTITAGYVCLQCACLRWAGGEMRPAALAVCGAATLGLVNWAVRPQAISFAAFGGLTLILTVDHTRGGRVIWLLPLLFAAWGNLHGGFIFGLGLLGIYLGVHVCGELQEERRLSMATRQRLAAGGLACLALCLNPSGPVGIIKYVLGFLHSSATQQLNQEFAPLSLREFDGKAFAASVILLLTLLYVRRLRLPVLYVATGLVFGIAALYSRRITPWFGMAMAPALAWAMSGARMADRAQALRRRARPAGKALLNHALLVLLLAGLLASLPWFRLFMPLPAARRAYLTLGTTPVEAAQRLCRLGPGTRVYAEIGYASYLTWGCPDVPVFIDTRFELYPEQVWLDYLTVGKAGFGWETALRKYNVNAVMARKGQQGALVSALKAASAWRIIYEDDQSVLAVLGPPAVAAGQL